MSDHPSTDGTIENHQSRDSSAAQQNHSDKTPISHPPPAPVPSSDPHLSAHSGNAYPDKPTSEDDISKMPAPEALKLLSANIELLVRLTGDVPPTPPPKSPTVPHHMSGMQAEKENIARTHSDKNLAKMRKQAELEANKENRTSPKSGAQLHDTPVRSHEDSGGTPEGIDGVHLKQPTSPTSHEVKHAPYIIIGADSQPINLQHGLITRKFYSKKEPPITINQYLMRLHQFCPMSTAVYLATSLYIHKLAVEERAIPVTRRNAHRLVLAGLRVAMKALEDLSYPHAKMAKVGGVSEAELARLEISFCFLANFELVVDLRRLQRHYGDLKTGAAGRALRIIDIPMIKLKKPRERSQGAV